MRIAGFLVLSSLLAAPAFAQAPWEGQQPLPPTAVPGVPYPGYVPGAPYPHGYIPGAPYRYRGEAWRRRELEEERLHHNSMAGHPAGRGGVAHNDPFAADQVGGGGSAKSSAATGSATAASATSGTTVTRSRGKGSASSAAAPTTTASTSAPPPCRNCSK